MANKNNEKLTPERHDILVKAFSEGVPNVAAARRAGIHRETLRIWLKQGASKKSGKYHDLYDAVEEARSTFWEAKQSELEQVMYRQATQREKTINIKMHRVVKLSAEDEIFLQEAIEGSEELKARFAQDGVLYKQEVTIKEHLPNAHLALSILERKAPEEWGKYETLKLELDVRSELEAMGLKPEHMDEVIAVAVSAMERIIASNGDNSESLNGHPSEENVSETNS